MQSRSSRGRVARASGERGKLLAAVGLFALAGGMLAWYYGLIPGLGGPAPAATLTPREKEVLAESQAIAEKEGRRPDVIEGSS